MIARSCSVFNCDRRHGNVCCADCKNRCKNRCLNSPDRCGLVADKRPEKRKGDECADASNKANVV